MSPSDFAEANVDLVVEQLTVKEAICLTAGVGFWNTHAVERLQIPSIKVSDGPNGIRGKEFKGGPPSKCIPCGTALGATWDTELIEEVGLKIMAEEAKLKAVSVILAPTCNIPRNPLGGRSFECLSEDPFLSGMIAIAYINGVHKGGIGTTIKHLVANDKQDDQNGYDSILTQRALREIYLMPFMLAQKHAHPWAYMTAYNSVNGLHASENPALLKNILRDEWKFDGMIMSDWFGTYSVAPALNAGLDLEMPEERKWRTCDFVERSIKARTVTTRTIKERAKNVLNLVQKCARGAPEVLDGDGIERTEDTPESKALLRKVAAESLVLLQNEDSILPLIPAKIKRVAIVGPNAKAEAASGGGSANLTPSYFITIYDGIVNAFKEGGHNVDVTYSEGTKGGQLLEQAVQLAKEADFAIVVVGLNSGLETEGADRTTLALPDGMDELVFEVSAVNPKTIVVIQSGPPILMPWCDNVPAILHSWYLGNATGDAVADVLLGKHNPSGKLSLTFPKREEDVPSFGHFHSEDGKVRYAEDLYVGYKHYQHRNITPLFAFGHGLSYTTFSLKDLRLNQAADTEFNLTASLTVTNTGKVKGSEVVQLYIALPATSDLTHPALQLKGFAKVRDLAPGASEFVKISLDKYAVSYWSELYNTWVVEKGTYIVKVGRSSDHLELEAAFEIQQGFEWKGL